MDKNEFMDSMIIVANIISKNLEYFMDGSIIELQIKNKKGVIIDANGLIDSDVSMAAICLKLVHDMSMLNCFYLNCTVENNVDILNYKFDENDSYYLRLSILTENIHIDKKKGFGLFGYNVDDLTATLGEVVPALKIYLNEKIVEYKKLKDLKRVFEFANRITPGLEPNIAMAMFISENKDLYKNYVNIEE